MNDDSTRNAVDESPPAVRRSSGGTNGLRWEGVDVRSYKEHDTHFRGISRQLLFDRESGLPNELRYFEIAPGGHSSLERHEHVHAVVVLSGRGRVMVGDSVEAVSAFDLVHVPPMTWHQFRADADSVLGFLCLVTCERDRPVRPTRREADALRAQPEIGQFVRL